MAVTRSLHTVHNMNAFWDDSVLSAGYTRSTRRLLIKFGANVMPLDAMSAS